MMRVFFVERIYYHLVECVADLMVFVWIKKTMILDISFFFQPVVDGIRRDNAGFSCRSVAFFVMIMF